jgi:hypothetical protein
VVSHFGSLSVLAEQKGNSPRRRILIANSRFRVPYRGRAREVS